MWVIGNWKMYKTQMQATEYLKALQEELLKLDVNLADEKRVGLAVPFTSLSACQDFKGEMAIGAQNMHDANEGAFTGEIGSEMLEESGASFVLLGHSERRQLFKEDDAFIAKKVARAFCHSTLDVILCIGEDLENKKAGETCQILESQLKSALQNIEGSKISRLKIAYEPVWAVGSNLPAEREDLTCTFEEIRRILNELFPKEGKSVELLYGGAVDLKTAPSLAKTKELSGFLVGRASLDPKVFADLIKASFTSL